MAIDRPIYDFREFTATNVTIKITGADNEVTLTLNNDLKYYEHLAAENGASFDQNLTDELRTGANVLVIAVDNHGFPLVGGTGGPAKLEGSINIDNNLIPLDRGSGGNFRQGLFYLGVFLITKPEPPPVDE